MFFENRSMFILPMSSFACFQNYSYSLILWNYSLCFALVYPLSVADLSLQRQRCKIIIFFQLEVTTNSFFMLVNRPFVLCVTREID